MNRLRTTDSFQVYDRSLRFTMLALKRYKVTHLGLSKLEDARKRLTAARVEWGRAMQAYTEATDELYLVETEAEDELRILHGTARIHDTRDPSLALILKIFPNKLTAEITPRGRAQAKALRGVAARIESRVKNGRLKADHEVATFAPVLRRHADEIDGMEKTREAIAKRIAAASGRMRLEKKWVREKNEEVYGALVTHFASRPRFASRFFRSRSASKRGKRRDIEVMASEMESELESPELSGEQWFVEEVEKEASADEPPNTPDAADTADTPHTSDGYETASTSEPSSRSNSSNPTNPTNPTNQSDPSERVESMKAEPSDTRNTG